ncbi:MAG TPA: cobalamin-dependent protein [Candidatus Krumholzibacteria bacterium]|nr:cobalamin-dependent protein [Candidatus Krumholzibacteria bacterium]
MSSVKPNVEPRHPIGVVSSRTGLPQDLIRAWERRYEAVKPGRGATGRRLYSDSDIEKLRLLRRAVAGGRRISDVVAYPIERLQRMVDEDRAQIVAGAPRPRIDATGAGAQALLAEAIEALEAMDRHRIEQVLREAAVELSGPALRQEVIAPLLDTIGERWEDGSLRIMHEHLASTIVRSFMLANRNGHDRMNAPRIVVTTPAGQHHELGALMVAAVAEESGWDVYYMGPNLPAEEIAAAVRQVGARALAVSVVYREGDHIFDELQRLRPLIAGIPAFVGGRASDSLRDRLTAAGFLCPADLTEFRSELQSIVG